MALGGQDLKSCVGGSAAGCGLVASMVVPWSKVPRLAGATGAVSRFHALENAASGIAPYRTQRLITAGKGGSIQAHHLIEKRFADVMGGDTGDWATIVVTKKEHQGFTNAWRQAIPYGPNGTGSATRADVKKAARNIYRDYPEILQELGL